MVAPLRSSGPNDPGVIRWQAGQTGSETIKQFGVESRMLVWKGIGVRAYLRRTSNYTEAVLSVGNGTSQPIQFDPGSVTFELTVPKHKTLKPYTPLALTRVFRDEEKKIIEEESEHQAAAPQRRRQRRWLPQQEGEKLSGAAQAQIERLHQQTKYVMAQAFPAGVVPAQQIRSGSVFFWPQPFVESTLHVPLEGQVFEIPFEMR